jgi:hypothetical protein
MKPATKGKLVALKPKGGDAPGGGGGSGNADKSLPDPTTAAKVTLVVLLACAVVLAILLNAFGLTSRAFVPAKEGVADFALFAGFYVAAQVIERLLEVVSPLLPFWPPPLSTDDPAVKAAHTKADRAAVVLGLATLAGVAASCGFGLYFLAAIGMTSVSHSIDAMVTGLTIGAGTKPLHDLITGIQGKSAPTTGTGVKKPEGEGGLEPAE